MGDVDYNVERELSSQNVKGISSTSSGTLSAIIVTNTVTIASPGVWVPLTGNIFTSSIGTPNVVLLTPDSIIIGMRGRYRLDMTANILNLGGAGTRVMEIGFSINGENPMVGIGVVTTFGTLTPGTATGFCIVDLQKEDIIVITGRNITDTTNFSISFGSISIKRIDG